MIERAKLPAPNGYEPISVIYAGRREGKNGIFIVFADVENFSDNPDDLFMFSTPKTVKAWQRAAIGGVYTLERKDNIFLFPAQAQKALIRTGAHDPRLPAWIASDQAAEVSVRARKRMTSEKEKGKNSLLIALDPFRKEYNATDHFGRLAIEVIILATLRRGS